MLFKEISRRFREWKFLRRLESYSRRFPGDFQEVEALVKWSFLFSQFLRAHRLCDVCYLDEEIEYIFECFKKLAYPKRFIEKILSDVRRKFYTENNGERINSERKPTISLPYNNFCIKYVKPVFSSNDVRVVNSASNTIRNRLTRTRPCLPVTDSAGPGVYMVKCGECEQCYVGETGRCFTTRLREHGDAVRLGSGRNAAPYPGGGI